jgi:8-oxo-dGTP diphosphatase
MSSRPVLVVCGILRCADDRRRFLIARRASGGIFEDFWELPGGKVEAGESPIEALERELSEELGVARIYKCSLRQHVQTTKCTDSWVVVLCYHVFTYAGSISARSGIHRETRWVTLEELELLKKTDKVLPGTLDFVESL